MPATTAEEKMFKSSKVVFVILSFGVAEWISKTTDKEKQEETLVTVMKPLFELFII